VAIVFMLTATMMGCATIGSDIVPVGKDTYQMSMTGVGFATQAKHEYQGIESCK